MARCLNCNSLFFKTLETRCLPRHNTLLYKKRCKRCKFKYFFRQDFPDRQVRPVPFELWQQGRRVESADGRMRIIIGEYSRRISQPCEKAAHYLDRVARAQDIQAGTPAGTQPLPIGPANLGRAGHA